MSDETTTTTGEKLLMSGKRIETVGLQTWTPRGIVVLTITSDGRVVPGEGLQMDDVAREFLAACDGYTREREAENARLRERVAALEGAGETMLDLLTGHTHGVMISPQAVRDALGDWLAARSLAALADERQGGEREWAYFCPVDAARAADGHRARMASEVR